MLKKKPQYKPGKKASYSNSNYLLLGYIIEKICKKTFADVLQEKIVTRLGLKNTYLGYGADMEKNECLPYKFINNWEQQPETDPTIPGASGAIVSTPVDLVIFIEALFSKKIITENSLKQMTTITNGYGMGFLEFELDKKRALGYTGGIDEYESVLAYFPEDSLAISWCSNGRTYPSRSIVIGSLNIYFGKAYTIPDFKLTTIKTANLRKFAGVYSSPEIPVRIKISRKKQSLVAQPFGYPSYLLDQISFAKFKSDEASVAIEFNVKKRLMNLKWGDRNYEFTKEN